MIDVEDASAPLVDAATVYASFGWHVFPCGRNKKPLTDKGFQDATRDSDQIMDWWHRWPEAAVGIACGASGLVVVDYDPRHDPAHHGGARLNQLIGDAPTRSAQTGAGGKHFYFRVPTESDFRNSAGLLGPGIDVRGNGGYVIAPPSHNEAGQYTWLNREPCRPLPQTLAVALTERRERPEIALAADGMFGEGQRNDALAQMAGAMRRKGMSPLAIEQALMAENETRCRPPLSTEEVRTVARSIGRYAPTDPPNYTEPSVNLLTQDSVRVLIPSADGVPLAFTFSEMTKGRHSLAAHLSLTFLGTRDPFSQRVDLESSSQRTNLRRELDSLYGPDHKWGLAINTAYSLAAKTFLSQDRSLGLKDIPAFIGARYLFNPVMPAEGTTVLFGDGSTGKSYVALSLAIASVSQTPAWGQYSCPQANVLYVDYEDSEVNWRRRVGRILAGLGLNEGAVSGLRYWKARGVPLRDAADAIKRAAAENGVGWLIVDSAGPACGSKPEDAETTLGYFSALAEIGLPCLTIAHVTKADTSGATGKAYGSAFWHNAARRTWFVRRVQEAESDLIQLSLKCQKVNDGRLPLPLGLQIAFEAEDGPVTVAPFDLRRDPALATSLPHQSRIAAVLRQPMSAAQIAEETGIGEGSVRETLRRHPEMFLRTHHEDRHDPGRPSILWARRAIDEEPF